MGVATHGNAADAGVLLEQFRRRDFPGEPGEHADHADAAVEGQRPYRLRHGAGAAHLDHQVGAVAALEEVHPDLEVEVFRAPTGELDARIATEQRTGGIGADVLWMTDPLSVQQYEAADRVLDMGRPSVALYVGGMGARDKNFYNTICQKYGYVDEAIEEFDAAQARGADAWMCRAIRNSFSITRLYVWKSRRTRCLSFCSTR